jgi:transposase
MEEMSKHGQIGKAALCAGMDRKTARRYVKADALPSELKPERTWRTRSNPFEDDWEAIVGLLTTSPDLNAKTILEHLQETKPGRYQDGQLRTLQRHIRRWRAESGPPKEIFFPQEHRPGEAMQTDFTHTGELKITIAGEPFEHLLCHSVLPYSNWESATACVSESMTALKRGVQTSLFRLGKVPERHQTDHSTAATHRDLGSTSKRSFNAEYLAFCEHFALEPRTIGVGKKEQNGDVESSHRAYKRRLDQRLMLRGSRDFATIPIYEAWLWQECQRANGNRSERIAEELRVMRPLPASRLAEYSESEVTVTSGSTVRVKRNTYSVPSRLIGERVKVRLYDTSVEVFYHGALQLCAERLRGESNHRINYRHVIGSLVKKPGAFERYRFREDLFPNLVFRRAYDRLHESLSERTADLNYLRILELAATTSEVDVIAAISACHANDETPDIEAVKAKLPSEEPVIPELPEIEVDLEDYDDLIVASKEMIG